MASIIYKKIFEVSVLHDYFLATKDNSFFELNALDKEVRLQQKYTFDLGEVLQISPTRDCVEIMRNHKLRFINTRFGFFVAQEVERLIQLNGDVFYKPILPLEDSSGLSFHIKTLDAYFQNYSGVPIKQVIPSLFYFSNQDANGNKVYPALSLPVSAFSATVTYEMGELADDAGQLKRAKKTSSALVDFGNIQGDGFVNRNDSLLLPRKFLFKLVPANTLPTSLTATLSDSGGLVKSINVNVQDSTSVLLDFCNNPVDNCVEEGWYDLEIKNNSNVVLFTKEILLSDTLYSNFDFGIIEIFPSAGTAFSLLDANGFIQHRVQGGVPVSHPKFEIRILSRTSYWRYKSAEPFSAGDILSVAPALSIVANTDDKVLLAGEPEYLLAGTNKALVNIDLPNPVPASLKYGTDNNMYSDVYISNINRIQP